MKLLITIAVIVTFFAAVRLSEDLDWLSLMVMTLIPVAYVLVMPPIAVLMSRFFDISRKFSWNLFPRIQLVEVKGTREIFERQLKSCPLVRCQVGSMYHMEAKAKMTMLHNVVDGVVFLMVNGPK